MNGLCASLVRFRPDYGGLSQSLDGARSLRESNSALVPTLNSLTIFNSLKWLPLPKIVIATKSTTVMLISLVLLLPVRMEMMWSSARSILKFVAWYLFILLRNLVKHINYNNYFQGRENVSLFPWLWLCVLCSFFSVVALMQLLCTSTMVV